MAEEEKDLEQNEGTEQNTFGAEDYLKSLDDLRKGTVKKEEYDKIVGENKKLLEALENGGGYMKENEAEKVDISDLRKKLFNKANYATDLAYFTDALALRDAILDGGDPDPFLPYNRDYNPTNEDIERAERIASELKECVEYANGDPLVFTSELQRRGVKFDKKR